MDAKFICLRNKLSLCKTFSNKNVLLLRRIYNNHLISQVNFPCSIAVSILYHHLHVTDSYHRCSGGSLRGRGWKYGSGFVDGVFPVLSPMAQQILKFVMKEVSTQRIWASLDTLPPTHNLWDDLVNVAVELRLNKQWNPIVSVRSMYLQSQYFLLCRIRKCVCLMRKFSARFASGFCSRAPSALM